MNSSGLHAAMARSNGTTSTASTPQSDSSRVRVSMLVSVGGGVLGTQDGDGVRVEGHPDHAVDAEPVSGGPRLREHVPVPDVHAVEVADRRHRRTEVARHVVEGSPDLHGPKPIRAQPTNTATGRAPSAAAS